MLCCQFWAAFLAQASLPQCRSSHCRLQPNFFAEGAISPPPPLSASAWVAGHIDPIVCAACVLCQLNAWDENGGTPKDILLSVGMVCLHCLTTSPVAPLACERSPKFGMQFLECSWPFPAGLPCLLSCAYVLARAAHKHCLACMLSLLHKHCAESSLPSRRGSSTVVHHVQEHSVCIGHHVVAPHKMLSRDFATTTGVPTRGTRGPVAQDYGLHTSVLQSQLHSVGRGGSRLTAALVQRRVSGPPYVCWSTPLQ